MTKKNQSNFFKSQYFFFEKGEGGGGVRLNIPDKFKIVRFGFACYNFVVIKVEQMMV